MGKSFKGLEEWKRRMDRKYRSGKTQKQVARNLTALSIREQNKEKLISVLSAFKIDVKNYGKKGRIIQYRVNDRLDIYPVNKKWHDLLLSQRGEFTEQEFVFVSSYMENTTNGQANPIW